MRLGAADLRERGRRERDREDRSRSRRSTARAGADRERSAGAARAARRGSVGLRRARARRRARRLDRVLVEQRRGAGPAPRSWGAGRRGRPCRPASADRAAAARRPRRRSPGASSPRRDSGRSGSIAPTRSITDSSGPNSSVATIGCSVRAVSMPSVVSAANGRRPVTLSTRTSASEYRSERASSCAPRACSGDAYRAVPNTAPAGSVQLASARARARPKSATRTMPCSSNRRFAGLMSRCSTPRACAYSSADATSRPTRAACETVRCVPWSSIARSEPPSSSSSTMNGTSSSPQSCTVTMCGWCSEAASWASARNRRRNAASSASAACSTLTATRRFSRVSSAR